MALNSEKLNALSKSKQELIRMFDHKEISEHEFNSLIKEINRQAQEALSVLHDTVREQKPDLLTTKPKYNNNPYRDRLIACTPTAKKQASNITNQLFCIMQAGQCKSVREIAERSLKNHPEKTYQWSYQRVHNLIHHIHSGKTVKYKDWDWDYEHQRLKKRDEHGNQN